MCTMWWRILKKYNIESSWYQMKWPWIYYSIYPAYQFGVVEKWTTNKRPVPPTPFLRFEINWRLCAKFLDRIKCYKKITDSTLLHRVHPVKWCGSDDLWRFRHRFHQKLSWNFAFFFLSKIKLRLFLFIQSTHLLVDLNSIVNDSVVYYNDHYLVIKLNGVTWI